MFWIMLLRKDALTVERIQRRFLGHRLVIWGGIQAGPLFSVILKFEGGHHLKHTKFIESWLDRQRGDVSFDEEYITKDHSLRIRGWPFCIDIRRVMDIWNSLPEWLWTLSDWLYIKQQLIDFLILRKLREMEIEQENGIETEYQPQSFWMTETVGWMCSLRLFFMFYCNDPNVFVISIV